MGEKIINFLAGFGSVLSVMPPQADPPALIPHLTPLEDNDWQCVGDDLNDAMRVVDEELCANEHTGRK